MPTSAFYRERADQAQRDADTATLFNVRERHLVARDTWIEMADKAEGVVMAREKNEAEKAAANSLLPAE
jgi:glutamate 5-kinase